jgi:glycosyltransferase involved in cell wall biosynthesis
MVVNRAFGLDTSRQLAIKGRYLEVLALPDRWISWWPAAVYQGLKMIRQYKPKAIFSTYPIATAHLIGLSLQRLSGLPWLADFRDSMTEPGYPSDPLTFKAYRRIEVGTVQRCAKAIFTTPSALKMYAERYPKIPKSRWAMIENGFDEDNFRDAEAGLERTISGKARPKILIHSGVLYPQERDPRQFFSALCKLRSSGEISAERLQIVLRATGNDGVYASMIEQMGLSDIIKLAPTIGYREALREMLSADGLLLFQAANCNHQIPAKLYEYLRAGQPIFALTDHAGDTAATLRAAGVTDIVNLADEQEIIEGLRRFLTSSINGSGVSQATAAQYSRRAHTAELAKLLDETTVS